MDDGDDGEAGLGRDLLGAFPVIAWGRGCHMVGGGAEEWGRGGAGEPSGEGGGVMEGAGICEGGHGEGGGGGGVFGIAGIDEAGACGGEGGVLGEVVDVHVEGELDDHEDEDEDWGEGEEEFEHGLAGFGVGWGFRFCVPGEEVVK